MNRIRFKKEGRAKFISHLDLMRTMQRVFIRAGVGIKHTEGFNPHPYMNFAMPLSVGTESLCELMDFELTGECLPESVPGRLNAVMPEGITVTECYDAKRKFKDIKWLDIEAILFYYDKVVDPAEISALLSGNELIMEKRTKRSSARVDVRPLIGSASASPLDAGRILLKARLACGDPALSPAQLISAIGQNAPELAPDFTSARRIEVFDMDMNLFR